jgi:dolichol-phosphate mannosyltransferase
MVNATNNGPPSDWDRFIMTRQSVRTLIVLPTHNERANIEPMPRVLRSVVPSADILVVDDGSRDDTGRRAQELASELRKIQVLERPQKAGLGDAYRAVFAWGLQRGYNEYVEIDCDFSHDPYLLPDLLEAAITHELVIGSR